MPFRSHVLLCYDGDDDCPVCRFIDGDRDEETLLAVINVLDDALANERKHTRYLMTALRNQIELNKTLVSQLLADCEKSRGGDHGN